MDYFYIESFYKNIILININKLHFIQNTKEYYKRRTKYNGRKHSKVKVAFTDLFQLNKYGLFYKSYGYN
jgi:hypothetical protein